MPDPVLDPGVGPVPGFQERQLPERRLGDARLAAPPVGLLAGAHATVSLDRGQDLPGVVAPHPDRVAPEGPLEGPATSSLPCSGGTPVHLHATHPHAVDDRARR